MSSIERNAIRNMAYLDETPLIVRLPRVEIRPDPGQPRKKRDPEKLKGLAQTMLVKQLQPLLIRQVDGEDGYMIVVGEGRWLAAGINEEKTGEEQYLDCILVDESNMGKIRSMQLIENLQREDMNELHVAQGYRELIEIGECKTGKDVADRMGVSPATVSVYLKVLEAPVEVQQLIEREICKIDTARTLMMLAEINKGRADALVQAALDSGVLKRSSVRNAYAEERARAENAAAGPTAEATAIDAGQQHPDPVAAPGQSAPQNVPKARTPTETDVQASAPTDTELKMPQEPVQAAHQASENVAKGGTEKPLETAPKASPQQATEAAKPAAAPAPATNPVPTAPAAQQPRKDDAAVQPSAKPLVVTGMFDVLVSIRAGTPDEDLFIGLDVEYGSARLAGQIFHDDPDRAWVQFGTSAEHGELQAFKCGDLEIVKVVQRG